MEELIQNQPMIIDRQQQLHFQEITLKEAATKLDPEGWAAKYASQFLKTEGTYIRLCSPENAILAAVAIMPAVDSQFQKMTKLPSTALENVAYIQNVWVAPDVATAKVLPALLYYALRRARIWGKQNIAALIPVPNESIPLATYLKLNKLRQIKKIQDDGKEWLAVAQRLKYAIYHIYSLCENEQLDLVKSYFGEEVVETHYAWLNQFYQGSWAKAVVEKTLTKEQYVSSLFNLYQYVKYTTRLCARAIAYCDDIDLRNHYINHFRGEINHELLIERDLKNLGADLDYLKKAHVPIPATKEFMVVQESTIAFYQNPILMLACPLTAEGVAAHMRTDFITKLLENIQSWGIASPIEAARFLTSHVNTDGGDDGHWIKVVKMIERYIKNEEQLQQFLSVLTAAMNGFERGFNANIEELQLWSAQPSELSTGPI